MKNVSRTGLTLLRVLASFQCETVKTVWYSAALQIARCPHLSEALL